MKGIIAQSGNLQIYRKEKVIDQYCPYKDIGECGDWCPLFEENGNVVFLNCYHQSQSIEIVEDKRE